MLPTDHEKLYSVQELHQADFFPFKEGTIRKLMKEGKLKAINVAVTGNKSILRIKESEVKRFIKKILK